MKAKLLVSFLFIACATQAVAAEKSPTGHRRAHILAH